MGLGVAIPVVSWVGGRGRWRIHDGREKCKEEKRRTGHAFSFFMSDTELSAGWQSSRRRTIAHALIVPGISHGRGRPSCARRALCSSARVGMFCGPAMRKLAAPDAPDSEDVDGYIRHDELTRQAWPPTSPSDP